MADFFFKLCDEVRLSAADFDALETVAPRPDPELPAHIPFKAMLMCLRGGKLVRRWHMVWRLASTGLCCSRRIIVRLPAATAEVAA